MPAGVSDGLVRCERPAVQFHRRSLRIDPAAGAAKGIISPGSENDGKERVIRLPLSKRWQHKPCLACVFLYCCDRMKAKNLNLTKYGEKHYEL